MANEKVNSTKAKESVEITKASDYKKQLKRAKKILLIVFALSIIVYIIFGIVSDYTQGATTFVRHIGSLRPAYYALALFVVFLADTIPFFKWLIYTKKMDIKIGIARNYVLYMSLNSMNITPGRWGRAIASYLLKELHGVKIPHTFPAVVADLFTDFLGFGIVAITFALWVNKYSLITIGLVILLLVPFVLLYSKRAYNYIKRKLIRFKRLKNLLLGGDAYFKANKTFDKRVYLYSMFFTIPSTLLSGIALYIVLISFGINIGVGYIPAAIFIFCVSTLFGMVSQIPGGLGVTDVTMVGLILLFFEPFGVHFGFASLITIFIRIATFWWIELYGFVFLTYILKFLE